MQQYIDLQKIFARLRQDESFLFETMNGLSQENLEVLKRLYEGKKNIDGPVVRLRKQIIDHLYARQTLSDALIQQLKSEIGSQFEKDVYRSWKSNFRILYPLYYHPFRKPLKKYFRDLIDEAELNIEEETKYYFSDFDGPKNQGDDVVWFGIYNAQHEKRETARQLYLMLDNGVLMGWQDPILEGQSKRSTEQLVHRESFDRGELLEVFRDCYQLILDDIPEAHHPQNMVADKDLDVWKYAPGSGGHLWADHVRKGIIALSYDELHAGDLREYEDLEDLAIQIGVGKNDNKPWNLISFRDAQIGDLVIANKGRSVALGIGRISGEYYFDDEVGEYQHRREVEWVIQQELDFGQSMFRADTFSPTKKWEEIAIHYANQFPELIPLLQELDPGLGISEEDIETAYWWRNIDHEEYLAERENPEKEQFLSSLTPGQGRKRPRYHHYKEIKPGDKVIGYDAHKLLVTSLYEITKGWHQPEDESEGICMRFVGEFQPPIPRTEIVENELVHNFSTRNKVVLWKLDPDEYTAIVEFGETVSREVKTKTEEYGLEDLNKDSFLQEADLKKILRALQSRQNIILQGPPGVGKTFLAKRLAYTLMEGVFKDRVEMVQFHQSYSYEDFIQGYRPKEGGGFSLRDGVLYRFAKKAIADPGNDYFFVIDEINRGNLSKIFGELMMLIEKDKRGEEHAISLTYSTSEDPKFHLPDNLYMIGTMNTADRSLAMVDYALRRRFAFISLAPLFNEKWEHTCRSVGMSDSLIQRIKEKLSALNQEISQHPNLGAGFCVGHSYFTANSEDISDEEAWWNQVIDLEITPLIHEYWFDDPKQADSMANRLSAGS